MKPRSHLFTSESVAIGHPDKMADQASDAILDAYLAEDPDARVACETVFAKGLALVAGEITARGTVDVERVLRDTVRDIGYNDDAHGFCADTCKVYTSISRQSPDIARGVDVDPASEKGQGAGDQGMMFGYAKSETPEFMPLTISLAHKMMIRLAELRRSGALPYLRPDGKCQVTVEYEGRVPRRVHTIVVSAQHDPGATQARIQDDLMAQLIPQVVPPEFVDSRTRYLFNPTGSFEIGGPEGDTGLTGRKIIVDTYGGVCRHGGGAFSGKDPSKVDRSANYGARYVAKNVVAAGLADEVEIQLAYAIGISEPVMVDVDTFGTGKLDEAAIRRLVKETFDLRPGAIVQTLDLKRPIYRKTAAFGHFGRAEPEFRWEATDRAAELRAAAGFDSKS